METLSRIKAKLIALRHPEENPNFPSCGFTAFHPTVFGFGFWCGSGVKIR
jgi:hypothetical protein